jgi:hypothetical protein
MGARKAFVAGAAALLAVLVASASLAASPSVRRAPTPKVGAAPWPVPPDPMRRARLAGLTPGRSEFVHYHVHSLLAIFVNGKRIPVPAGLGINFDDPGLQSGHGCRNACISPLHTHDQSGIIHVESKVKKTFVLSQFFTEWAVALSARCVGGYCSPHAPIAVFVDGKPYRGNPRAITLTDRKVIVIVIGTPPKKT